MQNVEFSSKTPNPDVPQVTDITVEDVNGQLANVALIDVRQPDEYTGELGHIPNAKLIVLDHLESRVEELPKDKTIVFICRSGKRSITASMIAMQNGYNDVYNMAGGMIRWNELGYEIEK